MRKKSGLWVVLLACLCFLAVMSPHQAHADASTIDCSAGNAIDAAVAHNRTAFQQELVNLANNINNMFPIAPALDACVNNAIKLITSLPGIGNPFGTVIAAALTQVINTLINSVCSQVMGEITSIQNAVVNLTKICLPLPDFGSLRLPKFNVPGCSGGLALSPLGSFTPTQRPNINLMQYINR